MNNMEKHFFVKKYQLWIDTGYGNWSLQEYDTLEECLSVTKYSSDWKISQKVEFGINLKQYFIEKTK